MATSEAVKLERERTKQIVMQQAISLLKAPLTQALLVWIVVEYLQTYHKFGTITGTFLEGVTATRLLDLDEIIEAIGKVSAAVAPAITTAALIPK